MNKKFTLKTLLALALTAVSACSLTSCKDYEEDNYNNILLAVGSQDVEAIQKQIDAINAKIAEMTQKLCNCQDATIKLDGDKLTFVSNKGTSTTITLPSSSNVQKDANGNLIFTDGNGNPIVIPQVKEENGEYFIKIGNTWVKIPQSTGSGNTTTITQNGENITISNSDGQSVTFKGCACTPATTKVYFENGDYYVAKADGTNPVKINSGSTVDMTDVVDNGETVTITVNKGAAEEKSVTLTKVKTSTAIKTDADGNKSIEVTTYNTDGTVKDVQTFECSFTGADKQKYDQAVTDLAELDKVVNGDPNDPEDNGLVGKVADLEDEKADKTDLEEIQDILYGVKDGGTVDAPAEGSVLDRLNQLETRVDDLEDGLKKIITGIIIQQVINPTFGSYNSLFTNIQTNALMTYYGKAANYVEFPGCEPFLAGQVLLDEKEGNMGSLYVTINPVGHDYESLTGLQLVNTQDVESAVVLGTPKTSDKVLTFGLSRAAGNGFYEVPATIYPEDVENGKVNIKFDKSAIKDAIRDAKAKNVKATASDLAKVAMNAMQALKLEALGVKCGWNDNMGDHAVISNYNVAAIAVKPLAFTVFDGFNNLPGYTKLIKAIDKVKTKVDEKVIARINARLAKYSEKMSQRGIIKIEAVNNDSYNITINYTSDSKGETHIESTINEINQEFINAGLDPVILSNDPATMQMVVRYDVKDFEDFVNGIAINDIANLTDMLNDLLEEANGKIDTYEEKAYNKVMNLLDKINEKGTKAMHKVAHPALIVNSKNGMTIASVKGAVPTVVTGNVVVYPTTYSAGIIAPVFKKYIEVNGQGQLVDGNSLDITSMLKNGVNDIKYYALDYAGNKEVIEYQIEKK